MFLLFQSPKAKILTILFLVVFCLQIFTPIAFAAGGYPGDSWPTGTPESQGMSTAKLNQAKSYALTGGGSGIIIRNGVVVMTWGSQTERYDLKSSTKSIGFTAMGLALKDGRMNLDAKVQSYHPNFGIPPESNAATGWLDDITLRHLASQTAGFEKVGGYTRLQFAPGTRWFYSDGGPNWLAEAITLTYRQDLNTLMFNRVFGPIGISPSDLVWRTNAYRPDTIDGVANREFGSGISANVDAMARIGYLYLRDGRWESTEILPQSFVAIVGKRPTSISGSRNGYGLLWWNNQDGHISGLPRDAYWSWGLFNSHILIIPSLDIVAARAGASWDNGINGFMQPIGQSVTDPDMGGTGTGGSTGGTGGTTGSSETDCLRFPSGAPAAAGYGASWDVFDGARGLLIKSNCPTSGTSLTLTVGRGNSAQFIWNTAHYYNAAATPPAWVSVTLSGPDGGSGWLTGTGTKTITKPFTTSAANPLYFVGYVCQNVSDTWKCGCANSSCTQRNWQLQAYQ